MYKYTFIIFNRIKLFLLVSKSNVLLILKHKKGKLIKLMGSYPVYKGQSLSILLIKTYKILFTISLILGTLISVASYSWIGIWIGLEINLLSIIPLIDKKENSLSSESSLKYFITQTLASSILLFRIIIISIKMSNFAIIKNNLIIIINSILLTKIGAAPFHFWFPEIMEGIRWINRIIILTWQKIAPILILMVNIRSIKFITIIIIASIIIGGILGLNQTNLRKIIAYSSINHIGWIISSFILNFNLWLIYFIIYTITRTIIIFFFKRINSFSINQLISSIKINEILKLSFLLNFLRFGGIPPFLGFFPKWLIINQIMNGRIILLGISIVILTLITIYYYIRIILRSLIYNLNWQTPYYKTWKLSIIVLLNFINLLRLIIIIYLFNFM